jgi:hypothetical protein
MKKIILFLLFPCFLLSQDTTLIGDVDCNGDVNSEDASLILQYVTSVIDSLPCNENMVGLTPEQLQEIIDMMNEVNPNESQVVNMIGPMYIESEFPDFQHGYKLIEIYYSDNSANSVWGNQMYLFDAIRFCRDLDYDGYNDWYLPTEKQLKLYTQSVGDIVIPNTNNLSMNVFGVYDYLSFHTFDTGISQYGVSGGLRYFPQHDHMSGTEMTRNCFCVR